MTGDAVKITFLFLFFFNTALEVNQISFLCLMKDKVAFNEEYTVG